MASPSVLYLVTEPWYFANHRLDHARALLADGFEVHVATRQGERWTEIADAGCELHSIELARGSGGVAGLLKEIRTVRRLVQEIRPDIVHAVALKPVALSLFLVLIRRRPALILSVNGLGLTSTHGGLRLRAIRTVIRAATRAPRVTLLFQTRADQQALLGPRTAGGRRRSVTVIPGVGVDVNRFQPGERRDDGVLDVVYLGRAVVSKGLLDLGAAVEESAVDGVRLHLYCALDETSPGALGAEEWATLQRNPNIEIHESTRTPERVLASADAAILPSRSGEGVSKFVLEALACGAPVLLSAESGSGEVIEPGRTGLVFRGGDPMSLRSALCEFASWPAERRSTVGLACRNAAEQHYSLNVIAPRIVALHRAAAIGAPR